MQVVHLAARARAGAAGAETAAPSARIVVIGNYKPCPTELPAPSRRSSFAEWAIQDSNLGPLPYQDARGPNRQDRQARICRRFSGIRAGRIRRDGARLGLKGCKKRACIPSIRACRRPTLAVVAVAAILLDPLAAARRAGVQSARGGSVVAQKAVLVERRRRDEAASATDALRGTRLPGAHDPAEGLPPDHPYRWVLQGDPLVTLEPDGMAELTEPQRQHALAVADAHQGRKRGVAVLVPSWPVPVTPSWPPYAEIWSDWPPAGTV